MTPKEMYEGLNADTKKVQIRIEKMLPKAVSKFRKSNVFPVSFIDEYRIPATNNLYILFFYANSVQKIEHPNYDSFCVLFDGGNRLVIKGVKMGYRHTPKSELVMLPQIHAYTSHFFQRYNERFLHKDSLSANEVAGLYFLRNSQCFPIRLNDEINRNYKEYGEFNFLGMRTDDGFCFTRSFLDGKASEDGIREKDEVNAMLFLYTTFMKEKDMSDTQKKAIEVEHNEVIKRCFRLFNQPA